MKIGRGVSELWRVENLPLPLTWPMDYTTACTTVQAVTNKLTSILAYSKGDDAMVLVYAWRLGAHVSLTSVHGQCSGASEHHHTSMSTKLYCLVERGPCVRVAYPGPYLTPQWVRHSPTLYTARQQLPHTYHNFIGKKTIINSSVYSLLLNNLRTNISTAVGSCVT